MKPKYGFWQISGWYGIWSKHHIFDGDGRTLCGKIPHPELGSGGVVFEWPISSRYKCKSCVKVWKKRKTDAKNA